MIVATTSVFATALFAAAEGETSTLLKTEIAAVILLVIAAGVAILARRVNFPFTVALVIAGFFASALGEVVEVDVSADLILALLVPPLLFEATLHLAWPKLKADLFPVLVNALLGTLLGVGVIGVLTHVGLDLPWEAAFAFGALISATDPVAVIAFFKTLGTPKRLSVLVEGESLFNDAIAVVAFTLAVSAAKGDEFTVGGAVGDFFIVSAGGLAIGLMLGYVVSEIVLARVDDALIETSTTLALAFGSFLLAEEFGLLIGQDDLHLSGILAVVAAGLMVGNVGTKNTSPTTRITLEHFWELLSFLVNSMVFLFIGLSVSIVDLVNELPAVGLALLGVLAVRLVVVYGFGAVTGRLQPARRVPFDYQHVMYWGGLRGAISLALALTLTADVFGQETVDTVRVMTFGVVLFTLLVQGTSMSALINRLGLAGKEVNELEQQTHQARIHMHRAGQAEVARMGGEGVLFGDLADAIGRSYQRDLTVDTDRLAKHFRQHPELEAAMLFQARRNALVAEQSALSEIQRTGLVERQVADALAVEVNNRLVAVDLLEERWEAESEGTAEDPAVETGKGSEREVRDV